MIMTSYAYLIFCVYEALCPFCLLLMAQGILPDDWVIWFFAPIIWASGQSGWLADRQNFWIDFVLVMRDIWTLITY